MIKCHIELEHYELAIKKCDQLINKNHKLSFKILIKKLGCLLKLNQLEESQKLAEMLFLKNPNSTYLIILTALLFSKLEKYDQSKATYYIVLTKSKSSKIKLSCTLMLLKQLIEENDFYTFNDFFELFKGNIYYDKEVYNNVLFQAYKIFSDSLKNIFGNKIEKATELLEKLCLMLNGVDNFLENRIFSFLAYCHLISKNIEKAIHCYKYKEKKFQLLPSEKYNLNMSLVIFNSEFNSFDQALKCLEGIQDILPGRIDSGIFRQLLKIQKIKIKIPELIEINRFNNIKDKKEREDLEGLNVEFFETLQSLEEIVINNNKNSKLIFLIALTKIIIGLFNEALENLNSILDQDEDIEWKIYFWRGVIYLEIRDFISAQKSFSDSFRTSPENADIKKNIIKFKAFSSLRMGEYERAKLLLEDFLERNNNDSYFIELLGDIEFLEMNYNYSAKYYKSILNQSNSKERLFFKLLLLKLFQKNLKGVIKTSEKLFNNFGKSNYHFDFLVLSSLGFAKKKNFKKAIQTLKKLKKIDLKEREVPIFSNQYYYCYMGVFYFFDKKYDQAKKYFEKAILKFKTMKENYLNSTEKKIGDNEENDLIIINLDENIKENKYNSSLCDFAKGDYKKFQKSFKNFGDTNIKKKVFNLIKNNLSKSDNIISIEIKYKKKKNQIQDLFEHEIFNINGGQVLPILNFDWPEPEFNLENIDYSLFLIEELNVKKFGFESIFPWITLSGKKNILICKRKDKHEEVNTFKYSEFAFEFYQKNVSKIPTKAFKRLKKVFN